MELKHLAIRELVKEADAETAHVSDLGGIMDVFNPVIKQLFESLLGAFERRSSLTHGSFTHDNAEGYPFISGFDKFLVNENNPESFSQLVDCSMHQLCSAVSTPSARAATGGYIIFSVYGDPRYDYLLIALVRNKNGIAFDDSLQPTEVIEVNLEQLHQAARINLSTYKQSKDGYLSFIGSKQKGDITHYFTHAFGCTDAVPSRKATDDLIKASKDFCRQNNLDQEAVVEDVVSYLERQRTEKQSANLGEVSNIFDAYIPPEQAETVAGTFGKFANQGDYKVNHEFQPHTATINKFSKLKTKGDNWELSFTKKALGTLGQDKPIIFDQQAGTLTLHALPPKVLEQVLQVLSDD
ncbi:MAG: nucleoid-associated protein [Pontibacterium sp.]